MNELSTGWKFFRTGAFIQMILVILEFVFLAVQLGIFKNPLVGILLIIAYFLMFWFLYFGLSCLNNNYPDKPLSISQKNGFNRLFILNFFCIPVAFSEFLTVFRRFTTLPFHELSYSDPRIIYVILIGFYGLYFFVFHILFLIGMYRLRVLITRNAEAQWDDFIKSDRH